MMLWRHFLRYIIALCKNCNFSTLSTNVPFINILMNVVFILLPYWYVKILTHEFLNKQMTAYELKKNIVGQITGNEHILFAKND